MTTLLLAANWSPGGLSQAILGLGFVIFVHELGHFAVAKMCGVKCEKFYLGFDIGGLKLAKVQWGETEYGIGILPLGGYVKMLGQDDNPGRAAEERRRSTMAAETHPEGHAQTLPGLAHSPSPPDAVLDPRSYMAKSVPQRMAIISAGVIMNVIFAFLMAALAYGIGVKDIPCAVSGLLPGEAAWRADLEPGDVILQIGDMKGTAEMPLRFSDLKSAVALGDPEKGVRFLVKRDGVKDPIWLTIKPDSKLKTRLMPTIGALSPRTTTLAEEDPTIPRTPAAKVEKFKGGDTIVAVDGQPVEDYAALEAELAQNAERPLTFTVDRKAAEGKKPVQEKFEVPARPMRWLGIVMRLGKVTAVQDNSPAAKAGFQEDDFIVSIDGSPPGDINTMALPEFFRNKAGETVTIEVQRKNPAGQDAKVELKIVPRDPPWFEEAMVPEAPLTIPALGLAIKVLNIVQATDPEGPAAKAVVRKGDAPAPVDRLVPGDEISVAELIPADDAKKTEEEKSGLKFEFIDKEGKWKSNWPFLISRLQNALPDTKVKLTLRDDRYVEILPTDSSTEFNPDRGFVFEAEMVTYKARSVGEAFRLAGKETIGALSQVYSFLRRIGTQISLFAFGGPGTIIGAASTAANQGFSNLLLFLTMLSANLAVINFLPIPVLDGGHMVFLALEGIFRRPVDERIVAICQWVGLLFIVSLMLFVIGLDIGLIPRFSKS